MLPYKSFISWNFFGITIHSFGLMVAIAFLAGLYCALRFAKQKNIPKQRIYDIMFYIIIGSIIGSRIVYVIEHFSEFSNFIDILKIWQGGLSFFGGLIGAILLGFIYVRRNKLNFFQYADLFAPCIAIGHVFGRIGCILGDGGHVGKLTTMPWGFLIQGHPNELLNGTIRHVTAFYSAIYLLIIFFILLYLRRYKLRKGVLFSGYLIMYSCARFVNDFFRIEDPTYFYLTLAQWICVLMIITAVLILYKTKETEKH